MADGYESSGGPISIVITNEITIVVRNYDRSGEYIKLRENPPPPWGVTTIVITIVISVVITIANGPPELS